MNRQRGRRSFSPAPFGVRMLVTLAGASVLAACAPAADPASAMGAPVVELEVGVATDCEAGVDVEVVVDGETFSFADLGLAEGEDPELPFAGVVRVPGRRGAPYRVTLTHLCDDVRLTAITADLVEGEARTRLSATTARSHGPVVSERGW